MSSSSSAGADDVTQLIERVHAFIDYLSTRGFSVGIAERERAMALLLRLAADGNLPSEPAALSRIIAPLLARNAEQQTVVHQFGANWPMGSQKEWRGGTLFKPNIPHQPHSFWFRRFFAAIMPTDVRSASVWALTIVAVLIIAAVAYNFTKRPDPGDRPPPPSLSITLRELPDFLKHIPFEPYGQPTNDPWSKTWRWYVTAYDWRKWAVTISPFVILIVWLAWLFISLGLFLLRRSEIERIESRHLRLRRPRLRELNLRNLSDIVYPLRQRRDVYSLEIDATRTAEASSRYGGLLRIVYRRRCSRAEYLILIEQLSDSDHLSAYAEMLVDAVQASGLAADVFFFQREPRLLYSARGGRRTTLLELSRNGFDQHRLVVVSGGEGFLDPSTGAPARWVMLFMHWRDRALLTPRPTTEWGLREVVIRDRLGFIIAPATIEGLRSLARRLSETQTVSRPRPISVDSHSRSIYDAMDERPRVWLGLNQLPRQMVDGLLAELRMSLGAGSMAWLAGLAAYPQLRWPLTLLLGATLTDAQRRPLLTLPRLLALSRLPWLRRGTMPDWLRRRLLRELDGSQQDRLRAAFVDSPDNPAPAVDSFQLAIFMQGDAKRSSRNRHDAVFLEFLTGRGARYSAAFLEASRQFKRSLKTGRGRRLVTLALLGTAGASALALCSLAVLPVNKCDLLATGPNELGRVVQGVPFKLLETWPEAVDACAVMVRENPQNALLWYQYGRALDSQKKYSEAIDAYRQAHIRGSADALANLAVLHELGQGVEPNVHTSLALTEQASQNGSISGRFELGNYYFFGKGVTKDQDKGRRYRREAIDLGYSTFWNAAFDAKQTGQTELYIKLVKLGAERNDSECMTELAFLIATKALGFEEPEELATQYFQRAADRGNSAAMYDLGLYYEGGRGGLKRDIQLAAKYYIRSAQLGYGPAMYQLATLLQGEESLKETAQFRKTIDPLVLLEFSAERGEPASQLMLAQIYKDGKWDQIPDEGKAKSWYAKVIDNNRSSQSQRETAKDELEEIGKLHAK